MEMTSDVADEETQSSYYANLGWFVGHLEAVAAEPDKGSEMHGHYNVAHEFWCFVGCDDYILTDPLHLLTPDARASVAHAIEAVKAIPESARVWTKTIAGSLANMRDPAWIPARLSANEAMRALAPAIEKMEAFSGRSDPEAWGKSRSTLSGRSISADASSQSLAQRAWHRAWRWLDLRAFLDRIVRR